MTLSYHEGTNQFLFICSFKEWSHPRAAGFSYDHHLKLWKTSSVLNARALSRFADDKAQVAIESKTRLLSEAVSESLKVEAPTDFEITKPDNGMDYFPFQRAGIHFAFQRDHTLLYDEMGVGKTIQAIGLINKLEAKKVLIICPNSLKLNWIRELDKWLYDKTLTYKASNANAIEKADIMVMNYEIFSRKVDRGSETKRYNSTTMALNLIAKVGKFDLIVLDEAHKIKNYSANTTKNVFKIRKFCKKSLLMTGTGILNRPDEIWMHLRWCDIHKKFAQNKNEFIVKYCGGVWEPRFKTFRINLENVDQRVLQELQVKLRTLGMIRRTKEQVFPEMPEKIRKIVEIPVDRDLFEPYERLQKEIYNVDFSKSTNFMSALSPSHIAELTELRRVTGMAKMDGVVDYVRDLLENDEKVVLFCHHVDIIESYRMAFKSHNPVVIHGSVKLEDRDRAVQKFQNDPKCKVFIGQMDSAGVGLTLTASSNVVFAELHWVPAIAMQCEDRIHRYGATKTSNIHIVVADKTIDAYMANMTIKKQRMIESAMNHGKIDRDLIGSTSFIDAVENLTED
jgi:SWI/SNF-related matrix-associated actin-dependent regulator 1 of chromatin subfamily A